MLLEKHGTICWGASVKEAYLATIELIEAAWWHPMRATDPALTWLRATVHETAARLDGGSGKREVTGVAGL